MTAPPVDYRGMLISIEARRAALVSEVEALDKIIAEIKHLLEIHNGALPGTSTAVIAAPSTNLHANDLQHIPADAFTELSTIEAITKYLRMVKGPKMPKDISNALRLGGFRRSSFRSGTKDLYNTVTSTLSRESHPENPHPKVVRLQDGWGLPEWRDNVELQQQ
jgi:hypothetical protein